MKNLDLVIQSSWNIGLYYQQKLRNAAMRATMLLLEQSRFAWFKNIGGYPF